MHPTSIICGTCVAVKTLKIALEVSRNTVLIQKALIEKLMAERKRKLFEYTLN